MVFRSHAIEHYYHKPILRFLSNVHGSFNPFSLYVIENTCNFRWCSWWCGNVNERLPVIRCYFSFNFKSIYHPFCNSHNNTLSSFFIFTHPCSRGFFVDSCNVFKHSTKGLDYWSALPLQVGCLIIFLKCSFSHAEVAELPTIFIDWLLYAHVMPYSTNWLTSVMNRPITIIQLFKHLRLAFRKQVTFNYIYCTPLCIIQMPTHEIQRNHFGKCL